MSNYATTLTRAAINGLSPGDVLLGGLMVVPIEPTEAQIKAAHKVWKRHEEERRRIAGEGSLPWPGWETEYYKAMITAAAKEKS